jgi:hypothetical protein
MNLNYKNIYYILIEMDMPYLILIGASSALVLTSTTIIIIVNFRRLCGCCIRKESKIESVTNPVNDWK